MATPRGIREVVERVSRTGVSAPARSIRSAIVRPPAPSMPSAISSVLAATTGSSAPAAAAVTHPPPAPVPAAQAMITIPSGETGQVLPSPSLPPFVADPRITERKPWMKLPVIDPMKEPSPYLPFEQRFKVSPVETAPSSTDAILSASAGGNVMMQEPSRQTYAPGIPQIPSSEAAVMDQMMTGKEITLVKTAGGGGAIAVGVGAGFLVAGPIGAIIGAVIAGSMTKPKLPPVSGFDGIGSAFKKARKKMKAIAKSPKKLVKFAAGAALAPLTGGALLVSQLAGKAIPKKTIIGRPLTKFNAYVGKSEVLESARIVSTGMIAVGAAATGAYFAAPYVASAAGKLTATSVLGAASTASKVLKGEASPGGLEQIESDLAQQAAERQAAEKAAAGEGKTGLGLAAAGAGAGFLVGGPPGAILGAVAGMILGRR